ncbi:hypothetical protein MESS2_820017 [Mesorhizobium metallidurans STM 2683]|uniref:Uncharacterized protein n=1 Tax=Mesorhizobium metallidurans STM 2683 TaxID=1297569 RepID=M5EXZ5_9HYPH|nr:hypothetical protein MESS2_820017 [Mesorhizobium metallidurans STM 2683]
MPASILFQRTEAVRVWVGQSMPSDAKHSASSDRPNVRLTSGPFALGAYCDVEGQTEPHAVGRLLVGQRSPTRDSSTLPIMRFFQHK